jgi:hypothetical protein
LFFVLLPVFSGLSYFFFNNRQQLGFYTAAIIIYLFYNFHKNRRDTSFADKHFDFSRWQMAIEYQAFLLPVSVPCLFTSYWYCFPAMHTIVFAIPFIELTTNLKPRLLFLGTIFRNDYTYISGFRRNYLSLAIFIMALMFSPLKLFPLVTLFLFNLVVFTFYEHNESVQMLQASQLVPGRFLWEQTASSALKFAIINAPVLIINSLVNPDVLLFNLYFFAYGLLMLATIVATKYANYGYKKEKSNFQIKTGIMLMCLFTPYMSILTIVFYFQARTEALKNLTHYLDDTN